ncbi:putative periplasmic protein (plasmid) [Sinorhizobium sojae CCBAU 05684]|uniref:Putative periplasmic protein n=1 Tax=Sinorhizobium sojae CCBAU 05684 TaxID=716928 RepID=A0A249PIQ1_9HYPH|nr:putative periplasmic protein [Sinorhizobium sojae CCBAU 05684]
MIRIGMAAKIFGDKPRSLPQTSAPPRGRLSSCSVPPRTTVALALLVATGSAHASEPIVGDASVVDGDTIEIAGERIQLSGVDAPEGWQVCLDETGGDYQCGKVSARALNIFLSASRPTRCEIVMRDRYGRFVATCIRADGEDVNRWLVESGNAVERENYSQGLYSAAQAMARSAGIGIWRGQPPGGHVERITGADVENRGRAVTTER